MKELRTFILVSVGLAGLTTSCKVPFQATTPAKELPSTYLESGGDSANVAVQPWTVFLRDTCLVSLINVGLQGNPNLRIAARDIDIGRSGYEMAIARYLPSVAAGVRSRSQRFGEYTMDGIGNDDTNRSETLPADKRISDPYHQSFVGLDFSWEVDIWNRLRAGKRSAYARLGALEQFRHLATSTLIYDIAYQYYELLGLDKEKQIIEENIELQELAVGLVKIQKAGGKVNQLAVDQFESQLLNTRERLVTVEQRIIDAEAELNRLLGRYPQRVVRYEIGDYERFPVPAAGEPDHLLRNRPDIRAAELHVAASDGDLYAARAAFYPSLRLSAALGFESMDLSRLVHPGSLVYSIGAGLAAPILQRKRIQALYDMAGARQRIALIEYEQALLNGYHEVYRALNAFHLLENQISLKEQEAEVQHRAFTNSNELFSVGYATYLEVITAQRRLLEVDLELTELRKSLLQTRARIYRALGGGWEQPKEEPL